MNNMTILLAYLNIFNPHILLLGLEKAQKIAREVKK